MINVHRLSNGIPIIFEAAEQLRSASLGICIKAGAKDEDLSNLGVAHFTEHMFFQGTANRSAREISELCDSIGGDMNAFTSKEMTEFHITALSEHFGTMVELLSDMLLNPLFLEDKFKKERLVVLEELNMNEDTPDSLVQDLNIAKLMEGTALAENILGTEATVKSMTREQLVTFYKRNYIADNLIVSVAGNLNFKDVVAILEAKLGGMDKSKKVDYPIIEFKFRNFENLIKKRMNQVYICFNAKGVPYASDEVYEQALLSYIVSNSYSSRLYQKIREERGLSYSIYSAISSYKDGGIFTVFADSNKDSYREVLKILNEEFIDLSINGVKKEELEMAKTQFITALVTDIESGTSAMMNKNLNLYFNTGQTPSLDAIINKIRLISLDDMQSCCSENFKEDYYSFTALGNV